jgi:hypothetical protein
MSAEMTAPAASAAFFFIFEEISRRAPTGYRQFATAAEAIRFAVEEFPAVRTLGACWMQIGDERLDSDEICRLYESSNYPLQRDVSHKDG